MHNRSKAGFSLLELFLAVMIAVVFIFAGLIIYRNISRNIRIDNSTRLIEVIKQNAHLLYRDEGTYGGANFDMEPSLISSGGVPAEYVDSSGQILSPYNSAIDIVSDAVGTRFNIIFTDVPQADCINVGKIYDNSDPDLEQLTINTTTITPTNVSVATVNASCATGAGNVITWLFR